MQKSKFHDFIKNVPKNEKIQNYGENRDHQDRLVETCSDAEAKVKIAEMTSTGLLLRH